MTDIPVSTALKGIIVGGTMMVPGVSGGSMAMILGIYNRLVTAVSSFMKHKKESLLFLGVFSLGAVFGMLLFARPLLWLLEQYPIPTLYFFLGAVAGGFPLILKQAGVKHISWTVPVYILIGLLLVFFCSMIPTGAFSSTFETGLISYLFLVLTGIIAAIALVLPGISVSYLLLLMGLYDETMRAISECNLLFLLPLGFGVLLGVILTTRILEYALTRYPQPTYLIILGFVLGSMAEVFPGFPATQELLICISMLAVGFCVVRFLSSLEETPI